MNPTDVRLDAHGFPIPPTIGGSQPVDSSERPRRAGTGTFTVRVLLVIVALGAGVMALVRAELGEPIGHTVARWLAGHAYQKQAEDDLVGALRDLDRALAWTDKSPEIFAMRGQVRLERGDVPGSLADFNKVISLWPNASEAYELRSMSLQRMKQHEEAIRDINKAIELRPAEPNLLNSRAYVRAIANQDLKDALVDVEKALSMEGENANFLDTRGYLHFLLGDDTQALADLDRALELAQQQAPRAIFMGNHPHRGKVLARALRRHDEALAVMYHHRGQIQENLGHHELAEADLRQGDTLGYNPAAGVY